MCSGRKGMVPVVTGKIQMGKWLEFQWAIMGMLVGGTGMGVEDWVFLSILLSSVRVLSTVGMSVSGGCTGGDLVRVRS